MTAAVPAPGLREVAGAWWDVNRDPQVVWDAAGQTFWLQDLLDADLRLHLLTLDAPAADVVRVAQVLAEGLAGCDFPPTGDGADPGIVAATLRTAGLTVT